MSRARPPPTTPKSLPSEALRPRPLARQRKEWAARVLGGVLRLVTGSCLDAWFWALMPTVPLQEANWCVRMKAEMRWKELLILESWVLAGVWTSSVTLDKSQKCSEP